ncbi:Hsp33 family molecular chaperone HslO [Vagococcus elongatus]|uniref:33 kDa chaperonin n=1 Tax=Vagococcus elongatus TaxID=180344 RepID=A0A430AI94_9ENTE|nr:Hsp33 family molecular chaperone HslO [Vagococcus elongatus]RSU07627.1 Hsp33 family molecular chaperone [Vagococcus elongatus]
MKDYLVKALAFNGEIRAYAVAATETIAEAQRRHNSANSSTAALGRTMVGSLLLGAMLKGDDRLTVKIKGDGPGGTIMVDSNGQGEVKGYIDNPNLSLPQNEQGKIDVRGVVGTEGSLSVIKDLGMKEPFIGQVPLVSGEIAEDFTYYLANSEQVPSAVGLSVLVNRDHSVKAAGGFMIQVMPGAEEETIEEIEKRLAKMTAISTLIEQGETSEEILERLLGKENLQILDELPVQFKCDCSKERFSAGLLALGKAELTAMIEEDHGAETSCHFCGNKYYFNEEDLQKLIQEIENTK